MAIKKSQVVSILYDVRDNETKELVESNMEDTPITFMLGENSIIAGLEEVVLDMNLNEKKENILIKAKDGYGEYSSNAIQTLPKEQFEGIELEVGMPLYGQSEDGETVAVIVKDFNDDEVILDHNHVLAGKDLLFTVQVVMVRDATQDELNGGPLAEHMQPSYGSCSCSMGTEETCGIGDSCSSH